MAEERTGTEGRLLPTLEALIDSQKRMLASLATVTDRFDRIDTEMVKLTRQGLKLQSELSGLRSDITVRLDAVGSRLGELEHLADQNAVEIKGARSEIVAQQNEILNALQAGLRNVSDANDVRDRLDEIERRFGP
ncbi:MULTISPECIES: hypothetical protein [unclassified Mesorhizobium]|uniref:hypothetical protein n=2 Tax=Mesorhizobium TaxID=68287 RepID=UPI000FE7A54C|nr:MULTISPECIES: hypothetical protein [unclassified Mesorhizobium]RWI20473.1 MAG: hypothetical protein EOQ92_21440 [Mesorhizobium sp.]RWK48356.1 MAG: hypothetical protein EOR47_18685 [Mesorhizobium sp.]RWK95671.1 MAG: hypothetical protein EOR53_13585 [Mesorhizobium sp.]RWL12633.1 MAG: hypothetical protein EOR45_03680 [Mesorhizobium sp.]TIP55490.1 MAG: hypothetical protein E5X56_28585 [Mesorhizobium sp.]